MAKGQRSAVVAASSGKSAPGKTALLIIDMINDFDFEGAGGLRRAAVGVANVIAKLRKNAEEHRVPVIYVNDNYGQWHSEKHKLIDHCMGKKADKIIKAIEPENDDFFVIKPGFSGFYSTNLPVLLPTLGASRLILTGVAADICVLFTAADAHMRDYDLWIPADAVASNTKARTRWALEIMKQSMGAETRPTEEFSIDEWLQK